MLSIVMYCQKMYGGLTQSIVLKSCYYNLDEVKIEDFGESVRVTDLRSGAVFGFRKYRQACSTAGLTAYLNRTFIYT